MSVISRVHSYSPVASLYFIVISPVVSLFGLNWFNATRAIPLSSVTLTDTVTVSPGTAVSFPSVISAFNVVRSISGRVISASSAQNACSSRIPVSSTSALSSSPFPAPISRICSPILSSTIPVPSSARSKSVNSSS